MEVLVGDGGPLKLLEETLLSLHQKLTPREASPSKGFRHGLNVLKWPFEEKEIKKILDMIERQKASLSLALDNNSRILQDRVASEVGNNTESLKELKGLCGTLCQEIDVVKRSIQQGEDREALHWITRLNFGPRHESILQSTLWCHGLPGAGKSVIAAIVFDYLNNTFSQSNPNMGVAVLYCDHQLQADQTLDELERSIFHQASVDYLTFPEELRQLHRDTRRGFSPSLEKLRSAVRLTSAMSRTLFVVLDVLDEANEKVQDLIVDRISNLPFQDVRLFCTSRSLPKFKHMFATTDEIEIAAFDDISIFVRKQVSLQSRLRTIIGTDSGLEKSIVHKYLSQDSLHLAILATISTAPRGRQERKGDYWKRIDDYHDYQERSEKVFDEFPFLKHASAHFHIYLWKAYGKRFPAILAEKRFGECQEEFCEEDTDLIEQLLGRKYATDVNQTGELGRNAVSYATMSSHPCQSVVCKLIEHHADVTKRDVDGMTPILYTAANAEYHSMLWDMIWAYKNANSMDDSNSYTTLCYFAELTLSSDPDVPEPTQKVISARIDFCSIVLRRIIKYWPIKDLDRILLTFWRFLEEADLDFQSANRRTLRAAMEDAELADIHIMSKVLYFCRQSVDEIDLSPPEQWQAVNQQQVEAQTGIDEVRGKTIKGVLSECLTSKMKELCGKRERQISEASRPSIP
ncbi:hypothetical protein CGCF413_v002344 [Colletotrichum fructicola]|nr:hypothetical protein CGCF413_v002344 [Colletotrichum fructicola]